MEKDLRYQDIVMTIGLIPTIICMVLCTFFSDAIVLYIGSLISLIYLATQYLSPARHNPNLVLLHSTLSLTIVAIMKYFWGDWIVPDRTVPIVMEILILCSSILYLMAHKYYKKCFLKFNCTISSSNEFAMLSIVILSGIHLLVSFFIYVLCRPLSEQALFLLTHVTPPILYVLCILLNFVLLVITSIVSSKVSIIRIAPVCNGKIYVTPRNKRKEAGKWDLPMEEYFPPRQPDPNQYARAMVMSLQPYFTGKIEVRFSLKHWLQGNENSTIVLLYVLPLSNETDIHLPNGKFVSPEEITANHANQYSTHLQDEVEHLALVAQTWEEYQ